MNAENYTNDVTNPQFIPFLKNQIMKPKTLPEFRLTPLARSTEQEGKRWKVSHWPIGYIF